MRIISGHLRSRKLLSPPEGATTRPMSDRVREAVFNLLRGHFEGATVYDAFCGTGPIGLEAVSRGAERVVFVEKDRRVVRMLEENIRSLGVEDRCEIVASDALGAAALARCPRGADLVFFDPPYAMMEDRSSCRRVLAQFQELIGRMKHTGFALLRTPWPFEQAEGDGEARARVVRVDLTSPHAEAELERFEEGLDGGTTAPRRPVDLRLPGAIGPETHAYGTTAVHLYMRKRAEAAPEPPDPGAPSPA